MGDLRGQRSRGCTMDDTSARGTRCGTYGRAVVIGSLLILWVAVSVQTLKAQPVNHPMDPLTAEEYAAAVALLKMANHVNDDSRYPMITLHEPVKSKVLQWKPGDPVPRAAFMIVKHGPQTFEAVVNLTDAQVLSWKEVKGIQPGVLMQEWTSAQEI